ncbi:DUF418 domain-containing protein, partial [Bacillus cereus group sp. BfR-BA-01393]|uniref:DUF418 domain-containing protein n=1 Tax=unclassified Bacillus cereus group TaxID=2750818 RepID=UPI0035AC296E
RVYFVCSFLRGLYCLKVCSFQLMENRRVSILKLMGMCLHPFMNVGQYALTNYITQSILTLVILSWCFKDVSHIYYWQLCIFGLLIIFVQILFSKIWSKYFRYGPIEWVWRKGVYKK